MRRWVKFLLGMIPLLVMVVFGYYLMGANSRAELGMIDDHEIAMFLGTDGEIVLNEIPELLMSTEVGQWGEALRFRPVYYTLRIVESMLWQDNAQLWYGARYAMFVLSFYLLWRILSLFFPRVIAYLFVFYALTMPFWPDLLTRLGPSEIYTVPAILMFTWGLIKIVKGEDNIRDWVSIAVGYVICVGSKENFLFLFPIMLALAGWRIYTKKITRKEVFLYLAILLYSIYVIGAIMTATSGAGADIYATTISYPARVGEFLSRFPMMIRARHIEVAILATLGYGIWEAIKPRKNKVVLTHLGVIISLLIVAASQYILYNNTLPTNSRYDFPALLLFPIMNLVAVRMILSSIKNKTLMLPAKLIGYSGLAVFMLYFIVTRSYTLIHLQSVKNADASSRFADSLDLVEERLKQDDTVPLVFVSYKYIDFEPIVSISRYLTAREVTNDLVIDYRPEKLFPNDALGNELQNRIISAGQLGSESEELFSRFSSLEEYEKCYSISFGRESAGAGAGAGECELITSF